jgi:hypothetical protein
MSTNNSEMNRITSWHYNIHGILNAEVGDVTYFTLVLFENGEVGVEISSTRKIVS